MPQDDNRTGVNSVKNLSLCCEVPGRGGTFGKQSRNMGGIAPPEVRPPHNVGQVIATVSPSLMDFSTASIVFCTMIASSMLDSGWPPCRQTSTK